MERSSPQLRLVAIFSADVSGYSRLMGADQEGTFRRLAESRELIFRLIHEHQGRVANTAGDAVLAEFGSIRDAVTAAVAATGAKGPADMGKLMAVLKPQLAGKADMAEVSKLVKAALAG